MYDSFNRKITYLRISVTDRCNLRCTYCMPPGGITLLQHQDILSFEEIILVVQEGLALGLEKVRITGGEPLVRKGLVSFIKQLAGMPGLKDLSMTTNGVWLERFAPDLVEAGLRRINISLDTLDAHEYSTITRGGDLQEVIRGIRAAQDAGLHPIKINCVVNKDRYEPAAQSVLNFCLGNKLEVRFIPSMDLESGKFGIVDGGTGGDCGICNRLRLTANGKIKPCLFSNLEFDVRELGPKQALLEAIRSKPPCGLHNTSGAFYNLGG